MTDEADDPETNKELRTSDDKDGTRTNDDPRLEPTETLSNDLAPPGMVGTADLNQNHAEPTQAQLEYYEKLQAEKDREQAFEEMRERLKDPEYEREKNLLRDDFEKVQGGPFKSGPEDLLDL